jgi:hypothetical protein
MFLISRPHEAETPRSSKSGGLLHALTADTSGEHQEISE